MTTENDDLVSRAVPDKLVHMALAAETAYKNASPFGAMPFNRMRAVVASVLAHSPAGREAGLRESAERIALVALLAERDGSEFDGEIHLTSEEGERIAAALALIPTKPASDPDALSALVKERDALRGAMEKIDAIRNSIIGFQTVGWSEHIYPLVAALHEAGFDGIGYEKARKNASTLLDAVKAAEAKAEAAETSLASSQAKLREMEKALEPFAKAAADIEDSDEDRWEMWEHHASMSVTVGDFRRARAALRALGEDPPPPALTPTSEPTE